MAVLAGPNDLYTPAVYLNMAVAVNHISWHLADPLDLKENFCPDVFLHFHLKAVRLKIHVEVRDALSN